MLAIAGLLGFAAIHHHLTARTLDGQSLRPMLRRKFTAGVIVSGSSGEGGWVS